MGSELVLLSDEHLAELENAVLERLPLSTGARVACAVPLVGEPAVHLLHCDPTCSNRPTFYYLHVHETIYMYMYN